MKRFVLVFASSLLLTLHAFGQVADGDRYWAARAEGHQNGHALAGPIDSAIAAYQHAVSANPNDLEAQYKLLRAIRFKGAYVAQGDAAKKDVFAVGKSAGEKALAAVNAALKRGGLSNPADASEKQVAEALRSVSNGGEVYYWDSVLWGEWALAYGKMAALRQGAADRIKRESTIAMLTDPALEGGGGARVLGRLHNQTPHVPFVTGWASDKEAVKLLRQSAAADPANKITKVFLAEAMVDADSRSKPQAVAMLQDVLRTPNDPDFVVEHERAQEDARKLLSDWGVK